MEFARQALGTRCVHCWQVIIRSQAFIFTFLSFFLNVCLYHTHTSHIKIMKPSACARARAHTHTHTHTHRNHGPFSWIPHIPPASSLFIFSIPLSGTDRPSSFNSQYIDFFALSPACNHFTNYTGCLLSSLPCGLAPLQPLYPTWPPKERQRWRKGRTLKKKAPLIPCLRLPIFGESHGASCHCWDHRHLVCSAHWITGISEWICPRSCLL